MRRFRAHRFRATWRSDEARAPCFIGGGLGPRIFAVLCNCSLNRLRHAGAGPAMPNGLHPPLSRHDAACPAAPVPTVAAARSCAATSSCSTETVAGVGLCAKLGSPLQRQLTAGRLSGFPFGTGKAPAVLRRVDHRGGPGPPSAPHRRLQGQRCVVDTLERCRGEWRYGCGESCAGRWTVIARGCGEVAAQRSILNVILRGSLPLEASACLLAAVGAYRPQ